MIAFDYSARIHPASLLQERCGVVFRYVTDPTLPKSITLGEASDLLGAGIAIGCLWEMSADGMLAGRVAGEHDAQAAGRRLNQLGAPDGVRVWFAADWNVQPDQVQAVLAYLDGAAMALGGKDLVGCYGGLRAAAAALDHGHAAFQTIAWSSGWDPRAAVRQTGVQRRVGGVTVDVDEIVDPVGLGLWTPGGPVQDLLSEELQIPPSIAARYPALAGEFPPDGLYTLPTAIIWGDAGAREAVRLGEANAASLAWAHRKLDAVLDAMSIPVPA